MSYVSYKMRGASTSTNLGRVSALFAVLLSVLAFAPNRLSAQTCTLEALAKAVDEVGVSLRQYNREVMPGVLAKMEQLRVKKGWSQADYQELASDYLHDARIAGFGEKANGLLLKIDTLGPREKDETVDCARITDLRASGLELLAVMKAKTSYTIAKIDSELSPGSSKTVAREVTPLLRPTTPVDDDLRLEAPLAEKSVEPKKLARKPELKPPARSTERKSAGDVASLEKPVESAQPDEAAPWQTDTMVAPGPRRSEKGYSIDEIRVATKGFFGTISTNLASVMEYAFQNWGRPSAYVLGNEGGGAFLAGLRYGKGTLFLREGGRRKVYWHGPSIGYDVGAEGSRTMFLIYNLEQPDQLFRSFAGIDGTAYLVGGVGITFLKGGSVVMAPIRSGIGLRVGASLGYVRFTPESTWNPF